MKDPARLAPPIRRQKALPPDFIPAIPVTPHTPRVEPGSGARALGIEAEGGHEPGIHRVHGALSQVTCAACYEEFGLAEMNYRIVLRCTTSVENS